jgi:hypothetical protein
VALFVARGQMARVLPNQRRVVRSGGFDDAFPRGPYRAEGGHYRGVLAPEQDTMSGSDSFR